MPYFFILTTLLILGLISWVIHFEIRLKKFFKGSGGANLEKMLVSFIETQNKIKRSVETLEEQVKKIDGRLKCCVQKKGLVRFNPFHDSGGNQSFSLSFLDEYKNGVVLSSLFGREINRIYAKSIKNGESEYKLTDEEKEAIEKAG